MENNRGTIDINLEKTAYGLLISIGLIAMLVIGKELLIPLTLSIFLAVILNSMRITLQKLPLSKFKLNKFTATLVSIALVVIINLSIVTLLSTQVDAFKQTIPTYESNLNALLAKTLQISGMQALPSIEKLTESIEIGGILTWFGESLTLVFSNVLLTLMLTLFLLSEEGKLPEKLSKFTGDPAKSENIRLLCINISRSIQKYIAMKTIVSAITGGLSYLVLSFADVHFAPMWGLLIFFFNFIPNLGSIMGVILPSLLTLLQFDTLTPFFIVVSLLSFIQFTIGNILEPAYFGKTLNLSSFVVLLSLSFWGLIWGLVGMFLSIPLLVVTSLICQHVRSLQWVSRLASSDGEFIQIQ